MSPGPAAVQAAVLHGGHERALHPGDADGVHVGVQEQRAASAAAARDADHVGATRCGLVELDLEPSRAEPVGDERRDLALARSTRDQIRVDRVDLDEPRGQRGELVVAWTALGTERGVDQLVGPDGVLAALRLAQRHLVDLRPPPSR